jgi:hypothetical protein
MGGATYKWRERGIVKVFIQNTTRIESFEIASFGLRRLVLTTLTAVLLFGLAAADTFAQARNIYITPDGGGAGNCTSNTHPPSWFNSSSNWGSGAAQIGPGTIVLICGSFTGGANTQFFVFQGSGASGQPISFVFDANASIKATYVSGDGAIKTNGMSYISIDGGSNGLIQNTANKTGQNHGNSTAISALSGHDIEVKNLHILDLYDKTSYSDNTVDQSQIRCVNFSGTNTSIHDNVMLNTGWCLNQNYTNDLNVQIYNNDIGFMDHGIACAGANYVVANEYIHDNHFHDMVTWDTPDDSYHHDGIHCYNGSGGKIQNLYIYNNLFDGVEGNCCVTAWIFLEGAGPTPWTDSTGAAYIYNNVIIGSLDDPSGQIDVGQGAAYLIYNNTFIMAGTPNNGAAIRSQYNSNNINFSFKNNVFVGFPQIYSFDSHVSSVTASNNAYDIAPGGNSIFEWSGHSSTNELATWQSNCNCDSGSISAPGGQFGTDRSGNISASSVLMSAGVNLSSVAVGTISPLLRDTSAGNTRTPSTRPNGTWAIGAYGTQSTASAGPPPAPSGLKATVN